MQAACAWHQRISHAQLQVAWPARRGLRPTTPQNSLRQTLAFFLSSSRGEYLLTIDFALMSKYCGTAHRWMRNGTARAEQRQGEALHRT